ncbi:hypothetical protein [Flavobacterium cerinum]|uniref:Glycosyltransferase RgtA/B/C/D-like domain-containing protein n=1 Tax=Flavobacterium cerinum TaxID=2502784 RepID=A0ABY5ITI4_9FLAO|nr:hypothetical protein [Flavobacterium cerinum]UUC45472.1 hypothetical protein NOX80_17850 [Flavobacterium cerinum]
MIKRFLHFILAKPLLSLLLLSILIRLFCLALYQHITIFPDSGGYIDLGQLLSDFDLSGYNGQRSPGYPFLLFLAGNHLKIVLVLQFIIGIYTTVLVYKNLLLLKFNTVTSFFTALLLNNFLHVIFYETAILTESLTLFVIILIINLYLKFFENGSLSKLLLLSLAFGFLVLIKPFYFFLPFLFYGISVLKNFTIRTIINKRIVILFFPIITFFGWSYINKINTGYFVPTTFYGINIAQNCVYFAEKTPDEFKTIRDIYLKHREIAKKENQDVAMSIWFAYDELEKTTNLSFVDLSYQLDRFSKVAIRNNPVDYLYQVVCISWVDFWKVDIYWNYNDFKIPYANKMLIGIWYIQFALLQLFKIVFVLLIPVQLYEFIIRKKISHELVFTVIIFVTSVLQAIVTYGTNSRFSYPFEFIMVTVVLLFAQRKGYLNRLLQR